MEENYNSEILELIEKLNNATESQILNAFKNSKDENITKILFDYFCKNNFDFSIKIYSVLNDEIKEDLKDSFFNFVLEKNVNYSVVEALFLLGREYQKQYFTKNSNLKNLLFTYDDFVYKVLIDKERHELYLDYVRACYKYNRKIPNNIERFKFADIETNKESQEIIKNLIQQMYEEQAYDKLLYLADSTKALKKLPRILNIYENELYELIKNQKVPYFAKRLAFMLDKPNKTKSIEKWIEEVNKKISETKQITIHDIVELIINKYQLIQLENVSIKRSIVPKSSLIREIQLKNDKLSEQEIYDLFYNHVKVFNTLFRNPKEYLDFIISEQLNNPFRSENAEIKKEYKIREIYVKGRKLAKPDHDYIDFLSNEQVVFYIKKEADILKNEALTFLKECNKTGLIYDEVIRLYFNSILKYIIPLDIFIENLKVSKDRKDIFRIYDTQVEGKLNYKNKQYYLDTQYGSLKISFTDYIDLKRLCPTLHITAILSSYGYSDRAFRITKITNNIKKENYKEILASCNKNEIKEEYHKVFDTEDFLIYASIEKFMDYLYLYAKYKNEFKNIDSIIRTHMYYHLDLKNEHQILKTFIRYLLGDNQEEIINELLVFIEKNLEERKTIQLTDLTNDYEFYKFRSKFNTLLYYLEDIDKNFKEKIINSIKEKGLTSCTYINLDDNQEEYFEEIKDKKHIIDFYNKYPKYYKQDNDLEMFNQEISSDLKFYLILKCLVFNQDLYEELKDKMIVTFSLKSSYLEWITDLRINIYKFPKDSLIQLMFGQKESINIDLNEKEKMFIEEFNKINNNSLNIKGDSLKEVLENINQNISKEVIDKIKDLSKKELTIEEKKKLAPIIIKLLSKSSIPSEYLYKVLVSLNTNNPYNMNNPFTYEDLKKVSKDELIIIDSIKNSLNTNLKKYNFFCMTPLHFEKEFNKYFKNVTDEQLKIVFSSYSFYGSIDIHEGGEKVRPYLNNIRIKESDVICEIEYLTSLPFRIIPHYDNIKFLYNKPGDYAKTKMHIIPIIDFKDDEDLLKRSKGDRTFFNNLSLEDKKRTLLHYCRYNIIEAFKFDNEKIIDDNTYLEINNLLDLYDETCGEALYIYLALDKYEEFYKAYDKNIRIEEKQQSILDLQKYLIQYNDWDLYDRLIEYLKNAHILNKVFIYEAAREKLEERDSYKSLYKEFDKEDKIEELLLTDDLNKYMTIKKLSINNLIFSYKDTAYQKYINQYLKYTSITNKKEVLFSTFVILMNIINNKIIDEESINNLKHLYSFELLKSDPEIRKVLFKETSKFTKEIQNIFNAYKEKTIISLENNDIKQNEIENFILFSSIFTSLRNDLEKVILNNKELLKYSYYLKNDSYYIDYNLRGTIYSKIEKLEKNNTLNIFSPDLLFFLNDLRDIEITFASLDLTTESKVLRNALLKKKIFQKDLLFSNKYKHMIEYGKFDKLESKKSSLGHTIKNAFETYNVSSIIQSNWFKNLKSIQNKINEIELYLNKNEFITMYDNNIIDLFKLLYEFEDNLINETKEKEAKINIFKEFLKDNNLLMPDLIFKDELLTYIKTEENKKSFQKSNLAKKIYTSINNDFGLDSTFSEYKIFEKDNILNEIKIIQEDLLGKERLQDSYFLTLQFIINYPTEDLTESMINVLKNDYLIIPDSKQSQNQELYLKASKELLDKKNAKTFYILTKNSEKANPYFSTTISHNISYIDTDFIIEDETISKKEKIYLYMRSILKYTTNFNTFIKKLYAEEFKYNEYIELNLTYPILLFVYNENSIKLPFKMSIDKKKLKEYTGCNVSIEIFGAKILDDELYLDFNIIEYSNQSSQDLIEEDNIINKIIDKANLKPYEKILLAISKGRNEFGETIRSIAHDHEKSSINKYLLFNEKTFNNIYAIYYTSKVLYLNRKHLLLKQFLYLLISNKILNDRFLYKGFRQNEYVYTNKLNSKIAPSLADVFIFENIDMEEDLKEELLKVLDKIDNEYKLYIYYVLCFRFGYFDYKLDLEYNEEVENLLYIITYSLLKAKRDVNDFFTELKENNIYNIIENREEVQKEMLSKALEKLIKFYLDDNKIEELVNLLNKYYLEQNTKIIYLNNNLYKLFNEEMVNQISCDYNVIIKKKEEA